VTDRYQLQAAERASAQRLRLALEASRMAAWELDFKSDLLVEPAGLTSLLGFAEGFIPTTTEIFARYYPGERKRLQQLVQRANAAGERFIANVAPICRSW
jgi:PAS domain-containing protein